MVTVENRHALIVAGGNEIARDRLIALAGQADIVVAADSGLLSLRHSKIKPNIIIGDLDSLRPDDLKNIPPEQVHQDTGQEDTDLEKAIRYCLNKGVQAVDIVGATGGRLDHSVNAVSLLIKYHGQLAITLDDGNGRATYVCRSPAICGERVGQRVSLIPAPAVYGLNSKGLKYPLENLDLYLGSRDAISNEVVSLPAEITWKNGAFLLYYQVS